MDPRTTGLAVACLVNLEVCGDMAMAALVPPITFTAGTIPVVGLSMIVATLLIMCVQSIDYIHVAVELRLVHPTSQLLAF
jgi:hypothetical protein